MRENAASKAVRYLGEGRVIVTQVTPGDVRATTRGDGAIWHQAYSAGQWVCDCTARTPDCSHLRALRLVTAVDLTGKGNR